MKKSILLSIVCCALVFTSCHRDQHRYNAAITEYHFANHDNEVSVKTTLENLSAFWTGDYVWKGDVNFTDVKADWRFSIEANGAIELNFDNKFQRFFEEDDYCIYTLKRIDNNEEVILHQIKYTKNGGEDVYDAVAED